MMAEGVLWEYGGHWHYECSKAKGICSFVYFHNAASVAAGECDVIRVRIMKNDPISNYQKEHR